MLRIFKVSMLLTACLLATEKLLAQPVYKLWDNLIQAKAWDGTYLEMIRTNDDKLLAACISYSDSGYDKTMHPPGGVFQFPWILMLDKHGNKLWDRDFYGAVVSQGLTALDTAGYVFVSATTPINGLFDVTAPVTAGSGGSYGSWEVGFNKNGSVLWQKRFTHGTDTINSIHYVHSSDVKAVNRAVYVLASTSRNADVFTGGDLTALNCVTTGNADNFDILLFKVNPTDTLTNEWQKVYGGESKEFPSFLYPVQNESGFYGFLIGGFTLSQASCNQTVSSHTLSYYDYLIIRTDTSGNIIWQQRYGGSKNEYLNGILDAGNGDFLLYGRTTSPVSFDITDAGYNDTAIWLVKINGNGNIIWDKRLGACNGVTIKEEYLGLGPPPIEFSSNILAGIKTSDGGFLFVSSVKNNMPCGDVSEPGQGYGDYWMIKTDSAGNKVWDKRFGGPGHDVASRIVEMSPGYYIVGGYSTGDSVSTQAIGGDKSEVTKGLMDLWFVGVVDSNAVTGMQEIPVPGLQFSVYPNPAIGEINIAVKSNPKSIYNLTIIDVTGKIILKQQIKSEAKINVSNFAKGIYIVEVSDEKGFAARRKLVKE